MRLFHITGDGFEALNLHAACPSGGAAATLPQELPPTGFLWLGVERQAFAQNFPALQQALQRWTGSPGLVDLHLSDLLNPHLPSHFEDTSWYDMLVFRRLATSPSRANQPDEAPGVAPEPPPAERAHPPAKAVPTGAEGLAAGALEGLITTRQALASIDTSPVGFVVFDRVLLTVHPGDCQVREHFAGRLSQQSRETDVRGSARLPSSPAELMLRMTNHMVDSYLDLRRLLTRQLTQLRTELLTPSRRFNDWNSLLSLREALQGLEDNCEDQRSAVQEWIDALAEWPPEDSASAQRERELLRVRSRDVQEHIERVLTHVRRLDQSAEAAVQMHFSALGHRTNDIMRTLTVLTAIFLPLNLITGIFGMNFDTLPLIHTRTGFWIAVGCMLCVGLGLGLFFWRKRYLGTHGQD
jgi:Mg2+ and Co2+ transporter CorA